MKSETLLMYDKYQFFFEIIHKDRYILFYYIKECKCDPDYSFEKFFDIYDFILDYHKQIKPIYYSFKISRNKIIHKFEKEKKKIQYYDYEKALKLCFCYDVKNIILEFLSDYKL